VQLVYRQLAAIVCLLALTQGSWAECGGWQVTAAARRACCEQSANCPSHRNDADRPGSVAQSAADSCCAASEPDQSSPSRTPFAASITVAVLHPALSVLVPAQLATALDTPELVGLRASPVSKHLLLSVFLV
jgi:hypothetical protein